MKSERPLLKVVALLASKDKDNYMLERRKDKKYTQDLYRASLKWRTESLQSFLTLRGQT